MSRTAEEQAVIDRFKRTYGAGPSPAMLRIERAVCGCDYGGTSYTTRDEADRVIHMLDLKPGRRLLEVGAGSGWPGLYLAGESGADVTLIDIPLEGLRTARARAVRDGHDGACWAAVADGAALPFRSASFDAVYHSDVLCCLPEKEAVLKSCRRVLRRRGRLVFSVILVAPGLSPADRDRAVASGPPFIAAAMEYPALIEKAGWRITDHQDLTAEYRATLGRLLESKNDYAAVLRQIHGEEEAVLTLNRRRNSLEAADKGLIRRHLFAARPYGQRPAG